MVPDVVIDDASADPLRYNLAAMIARWQRTGRSGTGKTYARDLSEYSVIQRPLDREGKVSRIVEFIRKPDQPQTLDSDSMAVGRYISFLPIFGRNWNVLSSAWGRNSADYSPLLSWRKTVLLMQCLMTGDSYDCGKKWAIYAGVL